MRRRSAPSRTPSTTSTSAPPSRHSGRRPDPRDRASRRSPRRPGLGLPVRDLDLLEQALVHSSWHHEHRDAAPGHNERLEFLGDAVVNLAISEALYARHPDEDEGYLSRPPRGDRVDDGPGPPGRPARPRALPPPRRGRGAAERPPPAVAPRLDVRGGGGRALPRPRLRAGPRLARRAGRPELAAEAPIGALKSPKSRLQEYTQRRTGERPSYRLLDATGPDHEKSFRIEVWVDGELLGVGEGPSRRTAETAAAAQAMERLRTARVAASPVPTACRPGSARGGA